MVIIKTELAYVRIMSQISMIRREDEYLYFLSYEQAKHFYDNYKNDGISWVMGFGKCMAQKNGLIKPDRSTEVDYCPDLNPDLKG